MKLIEAADTLSALSQSSRLKVFRLLVKRGEDGLCAGDISKRLRIAKPTLSFHLKELARVKLITSERDGRSIIYRLNVAKMGHLMNFLTEDCCQGRPELCSPSSLGSSRSRSSKQGNCC
ncbi:MAG: ArsR/SmtB family transcription factor [Akkermansiaceae bacterium]